MRSRPVLVDALDVSADSQAVHGQTNMSPVSADARSTLMNRIAALAILILGLAPFSQTHAQVTGKTFKITVKSSFGTTFTDCFRFDNPDPGQLTIDLLFQTITYRHGQLDKVKTRFKAVSLFAQSLSIMYYGEEIEALKQLNGEAVSEFGDTFEFTGHEERNCNTTFVSPSVAASSPW